MAITLGQLITFNALLAYFLDPVKNLINLQPMMHTAIVASDRLGEILDLESEKLEDEDRKVRLKALSGKIEIKDLDFRYGMRQPVLQGINLEINPGETVALVGESGSGKTTLAKLILNFFPFEKGEIILDGYHIQDLNKEFCATRSVIFLRIYSCSMGQFLRICVWGLKVLISKK